jgi:hypothetical protein
MFSRVKKKKQKELPKPGPIPEDEPIPAKPAGRRQSGSPKASSSTARAEQKPEPDIGSKRTKKKMSFSTPNTTEKQPVRRSKRLSADLETTSPQHKTRRKDQDEADSTERVVRTGSPLRIAKKRGPKTTVDVSDEAENEQPEGYSASHTTQ